MEATISIANKEDHPITYKDAGVDIDAGDAFVGAIGDDIKRTARSGAGTTIGGFGGLFDLKGAGYDDPLLVAATDGVGTKLKLAQATGKHRGLGIDLVAMCANDVLAQGAWPLFFLDYIATGKFEAAIAKELVAGIADGCLEAGCALIGGETAEMPGVYPHGAYDLAGFCVGAVERGQQIDISRTAEGSVAIAIASSGVHANGFSLIHKVLERADIKLNAPFDKQRDIASALLEPTVIYTCALRAVAKALGSLSQVQGIAHITGGGLIENPPRAFGEGLKLDLDLSTWDLPPLFQWICKNGNIEARECARVFNCGIGMLLFVDKGDADSVISAIKDSGHDAWQAGVISKRGKGAPAVVLNGLDRWAGVR